MLDFCGFVHVYTNRYFVPERWVGAKVAVHKRPEQVLVYADRQQIAACQRVWAEIRDVCRPLQLTTSHHLWWGRAAAACRLWQPLRPRPNSRVAGRLQRGKVARREPSLPMQLRQHRLDHQRVDGLRNPFQIVDRLGQVGWAITFQ